MNTEKTRIGFGFERTENNKDEWLTPPEIVRCLGDFDIDPCSPINRPWPTAKQHYTVNDDGLIQEWQGRVWCNPPYGNQTGVWMDKLANHGNGIALVFARTETATFFKSIWPRADSIFFFKGRISFHHVTGEKAKPAGAPSVLVAYGKNNVLAIIEAQAKGLIKGHHVVLNGKDL